MRVLIEALGIDTPGGGRSATINLLNGLVDADETSQHEFAVLLTRREPDSVIHPRIRQFVCPFRNRMLVRLAGELIVPALTTRYRPDLVHHAKNLSTVARVTKTIVTVYDLTILEHPSLYPITDVVYWRVIEPRMLRATDGVIAISQTTARDLVSHYRLDKTRLSVVYPGISPLFTLGKPDARVLRSHGVTGEYVLHVGSISRKKNLLPLLRSIVRLRSQGWAGQLVLVGRVYGKGWDAELAAEISNQRSSGAVVTTGPLSDSDLVNVYRGARVVVFPSLHEGFGLVPIEAMACGIPVVSSSGGALGEVVGDAARLLSDASDEAEIADAVKTLIFDGPGRTSLIDAGLARSAEFTRPRVGSRTLDAYRSALLR